jgi:hypothetical protein
MPKKRAASSKMKKPRTFATGGGNATASGVNFQQSLGALFCLWMLTETQVDHRLQLGTAKLTTIRMETEAPLDDALAMTSDGGIIAAQAKNSLSLSSSLTSEFGKTVEQIVRQWRLAARLDFRNDIAALAAYSLQTEQTLRGLEFVEAERGVSVGITRHCQAAVNAAVLGGDLMVKLIGRYLADHKDVFDEPKRRTALVDTLETFVGAGWPSARRLFYRLPELLQ